MNNIIYDDELITIEDNRYQYYKNFTKKLNGRDCVKFALFCAKIINLNTKESNVCIKLVEKWLLDAKSVSKQELDAAANAAYAAYSANISHSANAVYAASVGANVDSSSVYTAYAASVGANVAYAAVYTAYAADYAAANAIYAANAMAAIHNHITNDINLYLKTLLRTTKQYNIINHNNQHYEFILKEIINEDIDKLTDTDYNMLTDLSQEYYNINPNITNKRIFIELLRREYE